MVSLRSSEAGRRRQVDAAARRDAYVAAVAALVMVGLVALAPSVPSIFGGLGAGGVLESFWSSSAVLAGLVAALDALAVLAVVRGRRAVAAGVGYARVPVFVAVLVGGFATFLLLATLVAHLLGFE